MAFPIRLVLFGCKLRVGLPVAKSSVVVAPGNTVRYCVNLRRAGVGDGSSLRVENLLGSVRLFGDVLGSLALLIRSLKLFNTFQDLGDSCMNPTDIDFGTTVASTSLSRL